MRARSRLRCRRSCCCRTCSRHPHLQIGHASAVAAARDDSAEGGGNHEAVHLIQAVLDEVGFLQAGDGEFAGAVHLIAHGAEHRVLIGDGLGGHPGAQPGEQGGGQDEGGAASPPAPVMVPVSGAGMSGGRSCDFSFFSTSISATRMAGRDRRHRNPPDSAPHTPLKTSRVVGRGQDLGEAGERRADDVHAAHQFIRAAVARRRGTPRAGDHLERLRPAAPGDGEAPDDVVEEQPVGLVLAFGIPRSASRAALVRDRVGTVDDQVGLPRDRLAPGWRGRGRWTGRSRGWASATSGRS